MSNVEKSHKEERKVYKLLFVDVDGVLNTTFTHHGICPNLVERVKKIVDETGCSIVLSSAWRLHKDSREHVKEAFLKAGVPMPISCTPLLKGASYKYTRLREIVGWLRHNTTNVFHEKKKHGEIPSKDEFLSIRGHFGWEDFMLPVKLEVSHFVALDDIDLRREKYGGKQRDILTDGHFVMTLARTGLSENNVQQALTILGKEAATGEGGGGGMKCEFCHRLDLEGERYTKEKNKFFCSALCEERFHHIEIPCIFVH